MHTEGKTLRFVREGDLLTVDRWNDMISAVNRARILPSQTSGVDVITTPAGTAIRVRSRYAGFLGYSHTNISARSGGTAGGGTVFAVTLNASTSALSTGSTSIKVWNAASTGISSGKYVWVEPGADGNLYVGPLEC